MVSSYTKLDPVFIAPALDAFFSPSSSRSGLTLTRKLALPSGPTAVHRPLFFVFRTNLGTRGRGGVGGLFSVCDLSDLSVP